MKRPNGAGSIKKLSGNRRFPYAVLVTVGWDPETGKRISKYIGYYKTYEEAELQLALYRIDTTPKSDLTLEMVYAEWSAMKFRRISTSTKNNYKAAWNYLQRLGKVKFTSIRTGDLQKIIDTAEYRPPSKKGAKRKTAKKCSRSTLEKIKALATMIWDYAIMNDITDKNYAQYITLPKEHRAEKERFTDAEIAKIKEAAESGTIPYADCIYIMIMSGLRISEFLSLDRFSVDLENLVFRGGLKTEAGRNRIVPIHKSCIEMVRKRIEQNGERMVCRQNGKGMAAGTFRDHYYYPALEKIGVRKLPPHCTRHTFATILAEKNIPTIDIMNLMGHEKYSTTAEIYTHKNFDSLQKAIDKI